MTDGRKMRKKGLSGRQANNLFRKLQQCRIWLIIHEAVVASTLILQHCTRRWMNEIDRSMSPKKTVNLSSSSRRSREESNHYEASAMVASKGIRKTTGQGATKLPSPENYYSKHQMGSACGVNHLLFRRWPAWRLLLFISTISSDASSHKFKKQLPRVP